MLSRLFALTPVLAASLAAPLHSTRSSSSDLEARDSPTTIQARDGCKWLQVRSLDENSIPETWERSLDDSTNWHFDARDHEFGQSDWGINARDPEFDHFGWPVYVRDLDLDQSDWEFQTRDRQWDSNPGLQERSKIGDRIKNFFKKVGGVLKKVIGLRSLADEEHSGFEKRAFQGDQELEVRGIGYYVKKAGVLIGKGIQKITPWRIGKKSKAA